MRQFTPETIFLSVVIVIFSCTLIAENIKKNSKSSTPKYKKTTIRKRKKKKRIKPNDYFKSNKYHADMTHEYIESVWDEIKKN